jgi:hypothetical protein
MGFTHRWQISPFRGSNFWVRQPMGFTHRWRISPIQGY